MECLCVERPRYAITMLVDLALRTQVLGIPDRQLWDHFPTLGYCVGADLQQVVERP